MKNIYSGITFGALCTLLLTVCLGGGNSSSSATAAAPAPKSNLNWGVKLQKKYLLLFLSFVSFALLSGCLGGGSSTTAASGGSTAISTYTIGGTVSGLTGTLVLQNNAGDNLTATTNAVGTFATPLASGSAYSVTVLTQPTGQTCTVTNGSGTVSTSNVTNVAVACTTNITTYTIGGTVSGLTGTLVLQNNSGDNLTATTNGAGTFATPLASGSAYSVTVLTQPTGQTCTITNASGTVTTANVTNVTVSCSTGLLTSYSIGATVSGLVGSGLVLQNNLGNNLSVTANGSVSFSSSLPTGSAYSITVHTQPTGQTCIVANGSGTISTSNVTNPTLTCSSGTVSSYSIGGSVSGLTGTGLVLQDNLSDNLAITGNGGYTFASKLADTSTYSVSVLTQPSGQICAVTSGNGTLAGANVATSTVSCTAVVTSVSCTGTTGTAGFGGIQLYNPANYIGYTLSSTAGLGYDNVTVNWGAMYTYSSLTGAYTGSLVATLWAVTSSYSGGTISGTRVANVFPSFVGVGAFSTSQLYAGYHSSQSIVDTVGSYNPPAGQYCMVVTLEEYMGTTSCPGTGYCTVDWIQFSSPQTFH